MTRLAHGSSTIERLKSWLPSVVTPPCAPRPPPRPPPPLCPPRPRRLPLCPPPRPPRDWRKAILWSGSPPPLHPIWCPAMTPPGGLAWEAADVALLFLLLPKQPGNCALSIFVSSFAAFIVADPCWLPRRQLAAAAAPVVLDSVDRSPDLRAAGLARRHVRGFESE